MYVRKEFRMLPQTNEVFSSALYNSTAG